MSFFPYFLNRDAAGGKKFKAAMEFTDPGIGAWTLAVDDGGAEMIEGKADDADLVMTQDVVSFVKTWNQMWDPAEGMQSGAVQVNDMEALMTFAQLFPPPDPNKAF
jgi:hypothetical protein